MSWWSKKGWNPIEIARPIKEREPSERWVSQLDVELVEAGAAAMHRADIEWLKEHSSKLKYDPTAIVIDLEDWGKFIGDE